LIFSQISIVQAVNNIRIKCSRANDSLPFLLATLGCLGAEWKNQVGVLMKTVAIFFCICLIAAEGLAGDKQVVQLADTNLERVVRQALQLSTTQQIYDVDVAGITELSACGTGITDARGIEKLTGLRRLNVSFNDITNLDVSACTNLCALFCSYNRFIINLNVSGCANLRELDCVSSQLPNLDISSCHRLQVLWCGDNDLTNLNVFSCTNLQTLECFNNQLGKLDVSACTNLQTLNCGTDQLTSLDVSACTNLRQLFCERNQLTILNIASNKVLADVYVTNNPLTNIVVWWTPPAISNKPANLKLLYDGNPTFSNPK
jgi:hypothetical protein